jgi:hypothetical protein
MPGTLGLSPPRLNIHLYGLYIVPLGAKMSDRAGLVELSASLVSLFSDRVFRSVTCLKYL